MKKTIIEIKNKQHVFDAAGAGYKHDIIDLGIKTVQTVQTAQLYVLSGNLSDKDTKKMAMELLADTITQDFVVYSNPSGKPGKTTGNIIVDVFYKPGVTDAVGESTFKAAKDMGMTNLIEVHTGFRYYLTGKFTGETIEKICTKLLANVIVQQYKII
jgi:phosphoribosylformylglycinamidine (FGAM) synthase PurS component